jgi:hypothetical protein
MKRRFALITPYAEGFEPRMNGVQRFFALINRSFALVCEFGHVPPLPPAKAHGDAFAG